MATVTYKGVDLFGPYVTTNHRPNPHACQVFEYWGQNGTKAHFGGGRGRVFTVSFTLEALSPAALRSLELAILAYAGTPAGTLVDEYGSSWPNVIFKGEFGESGPMTFPAGGVAREYQATFHGLT